MKPAISLQGNVPSDVGSASLFDTAYVHPWLRDSFLPWWYYDRFSKYTTWLVSGTKAGLDQWIGEISPDRFHASKGFQFLPFIFASTKLRLVFFNKSTRAIPYVSAQYRSSSSIDTFRSYIAQVPLLNTHGRKINIAPWLAGIDENGIARFIQNGRPEAAVMEKTICKPDIVILATGYNQSFKFLDDQYPKSKDANIRGIWRDTDETLAFIGFVRPSFGKSLIMCSPSRTNSLQAPSHPSQSFKRKFGSSIS